MPYLLCHDAAPDGGVRFWGTFVCRDVAYTVSTPSPYGRGGGGWGAGNKKGDFARQTYP